jgi:hypothetical protein
MPNTDSSQAAFTQRKRGQALGIFHAANPDNNRNGPQSNISGSVYHVIQVGNASNVGAVAPPVVITIPDAPTIGTATPGNTQASVTFTTPVNDGGSDITSYTVTSSPEGLVATGTASPIVVTGLTNGTAYTFTVVATNGLGPSAPSSASSPVTPATVPDAPTIGTVIQGNAQATVAFTAPANNGGSDITSYTITSSPGGFTASGTSSPLIVTGLTNGTAYTFTVTATNIAGPSSPSSASSAVTPAPDIASAPIITGVVSKTTTTVTLSFTQPAGGLTITNYKYSINGGGFTAFAPVDIVSPVMISGLTPGTSYTFALKAVNSAGDSLPSNTQDVTTYIVHVDTISTSGTWTAPEGITSIKYLVVGGGGGGGAAYSSIAVLGNVPVKAFPSTGYYINNVAGSFFGFMYNGGSRYASAIPVRMTVTGATSYPITPNGANYSYNKWYGDEIIYTISNGFPLTTNYIPPNPINTTYCNSVSGGGGGGAGGQVLTNTYTVVPNTVYTVTIGSGGAGGIGASGSEQVGSAGTTSSFHTIIAAGGSGGGASRTTTNPVNGHNKGGAGGQANSTFVSGQGGAGLFNTPTNNYGKWNSATPGVQPWFIDFDENGASEQYAGGGPGGIPNTPTTASATANSGNGGSGTGATLNSFASGAAGASGIVKIKYYI